jgi:hypothetical protein
MRTLNNLDIATGEVPLTAEDGTIYSSEGPPDTWRVKNELPGQLLQWCYAFDLSGCTEEQIAMIENGTAPVKNWIFVDANSTKLFPEIVGDFDWTEHGGSAAPEVSTGGAEILRSGVGVVLQVAAIVALLYIIDEWPIILRDGMSTRRHSSTSRACGDSKILPDRLLLRPRALSDNLNIADPVLTDAVQRFSPHSLVIESSSAVEQRFHRFQSLSASLLEEEEDQNSHDDIQAAVEEEHVASCGMVSLGLESGDSDNKPHEAIMYGVTKLNRKLNSHCVATPTEVPTSRMRDGKIYVLSAEDSNAIL